MAKFQYSLDGGASYIDVPVTPGTSVFATVTISQQGNTTVRYRAVDSSGNESLGVTVTTTLTQPSAAGATGVRLQSTTGRGAGDVLVIDTGANEETATIASVPTPAPPSPNPNVLLTAPLTNAHAAGAVVSATPPYRTIQVLIDSFAPLPNWATLATTLQSAAAVPGATEIRLANTTDRAAGDVLIVDQGANAETVTIQSLVVPAPAAPAANVVLTESPDQNASDRRRRVRPGNPGRDDPPVEDADARSSSPTRAAVMRRTRCRTARAARRPGG